jgi:hypothetical protein
LIPVRVSALVVAALTTQLTSEVADLFIRHDLEPWLAWLATPANYESLPEAGPGRRLTIGDAHTVVGFHLFIAPDFAAVGGLIVYDADVHTAPETWA